MVDPGLGVLKGVGVWEPVSHVDCELVVVAVPHEFDCVRGPEVADRDVVRQVKDCNWVGDSHGTADGGLGESFTTGAGSMRGVCDAIGDIGHDLWRGIKR